MKTKGKLITTIIVFLLILSLVIVGIIGIAKNGRGIDGDISLMSPDVRATISGKVWGHKNHKEKENAQILQGDSWDENTGNNNVNNITWSDLDLTFADEDTDIVIEIVIKNDDANVDGKPIKVDIENKTVTQGKNFSVLIENSGTSTSDIIGVGETIVYTITLKILDKGLKVDGKLDIAFNLSKD